MTQQPVAEFRLHLEAGQIEPFVRFDPCLRVQDHE